MTDEDVKQEVQKKSQKMQEPRQRTGRLDGRDKLGYKESAGGDSAVEVKALNYELWIDIAFV